MSWAAQRRLVILLILGSIALAFFATLLIATLYKTPSCADTVQNQGEEGVDCGGSCTYLCQASELPPTVLFTKALPNGTGGTDVIAEVENKNATAAAQQVSYTLTLYGTDQTLLRKINGTLDLPPATRVPVFVPGITFGKQHVGSAFLDVDPASVHWYRVAHDPRVLPHISSQPIQSGTTAAPRIDTVATNESTTAMTNVRAIVVVHSDTDEIVAASSTLVPSIPPQGQTTLTFTWNIPFPSIPALIEVIPMIPLPDR